MPGAEALFKDAIERALAAKGEAVEVAIPGPDPGAQFREWVDEAARLSHRLILAPDGHSKSVVEFAERVFYAAAQVRMFFGTPPTTPDGVLRAMAAAAELADEWHALAVNAALEKPMAGAIRTKERGSVGGQRKAQKAKPRVEARWATIATYAKSLRATSRSRAEILAAVAKRFDVKASTLARNPAVRAHLPRARRNPRA